jgi:hypothetical protein
MPGCTYAHKPYKSTQSYSELNASSVACPQALRVQGYVKELAGDAMRGKALLAVHTICTEASWYHVTGTDKLP